MPARHDCQALALPECFPKWIAIEDNFAVAQLKITDVREVEEMQQVRQQPIINVTSFSLRRTLKEYHPF